MGLVITGMHRSGTSAVARVAEALGLAHGGVDMGPAPDNPRGFFERRDVMAMNDRWLASLGGSWWAPPVTSSATWSHLDARDLADDRSALGLFDPTADQWFVKDPRISLLLPLWDRLALRKVPAVLAVRDPRECVMSIHLRDGIATRRALALWFAYVREALLDSADRQMLVLSYDAMVEAPEPAVIRLAEFIAMTCGETEHLQSLEALADLVEPALRRSRRTNVHGVSETEMDAAQDLYLLISKLHADPDADVPESIDVPSWVEDVLEELRDSLRLEQRADAASAIAGELQVRIAEMQAPGGELTELRERAANHESRSLEAEARVEALTLEIDLLRRDLETGRTAQAVVDVELARVRTLLAEAETAQDVAEEVNALGLCIVDLEGQVATARDSIAALVVERTVLSKSLRDARLRNDATSETVRTLTEALERGRGSTVRLQGELVAAEQALSVAREAFNGRVAALETQLEDGAVEARRLQDRLVRATRQVHELTALRVRLTLEIGEAQTLASRRQEALAALTVLLERVRAEAQVANEAAARAAAINAALVVEQARRERLREALVDAVSEGQRLAAELETIRGSRSYRYGRRLTSPARLFRSVPVHDDAEPTDPESATGANREAS